MPDPPYRPPYPKPLDKSEKRSLYQLVKRARKSWIHTLYKGSYENNMSRVKLPFSYLYTPKEPASVRAVLTDDYKDFPKHPLMHESLKPLLGESIFTTNGEVWERQRRILDPAFSTAGLKKVFPVMKEAVKDMRDRLSQLKEGEVTELDKEMTHVTADIIMRTILSVPIKTQEALEVFHKFEIFQEKAIKVNMLAAIKLPRWFFPREYYKWKKSGSQIRNTIGNIIKKRFAEYNEKKGETDYGDILESLMNSTDEVTGTKFDETELIDQIVMLFLAGHETSASALSWAFHILAHQPQAADELAAEAAASYDSLETMTFSEVYKLKKTREVFKEVLRLYPPVAFFSRMATGNKKVGDREVEEGDSISIAPWLIHRHRKLWNDPDLFKPERFKQGENKKNLGAYLPFSQGPRICIGAAFAQQEAYMIIATVMKHHILEPDPDHEPDPASRLTLRSLNGIRLRIKKRRETPEITESIFDQTKASEEQENIAQSTTPDGGGKCPFGFG